jgi:hypothetical protein
MTPRTLRWVTGGVAALSVALLVGGVPLSYLSRHAAPAGLWTFPDVFEELTFVVVPVVGFVLASRRPANKIGWIFLAAGLLLGWPLSTAGSKSGPCPARARRSPRTCRCLPCLPNPDAARPPAEPVGRGAPGGSRLNVGGPG